MSKNYKTRFFKHALAVFCFCLIWTSILQAQGLFQMNGSGSQADLGGGCYRLTSAANNQFGSMWYRKKADLNQDFDLTARLNFGTQDGNGADGIVFAFQNVCTSSGGGGGGIGIFGVNPSLFVEFDTYQNTNYGDPSYDHIALLRNGDVNHSGSNSLVPATGITPTNANVENGQDYTVRILWTTADSTLKVYVNSDLRITYTQNVINQIFSGNPYVYWGFTAATGGYNNLHSVCIDTLPNNEIELSDITICEGESQQVFLPGATTYSWSPNYNISNTSVYNPFLFPATTTTYVVAITDACNNVQTDTITVFVNPLPAVSFTLPFTQKCLNDAALTLSSGTPSGGTYSGSGVSGNSFDPSSAGTGNHPLVYSYTNAQGCTNYDTSWVEVNPLPVVTFSSLPTVCENGSVITLNQGVPSGGIYSGPGVSGNTFDPSAAGPGIHTITYSYTNAFGCDGQATQTITVNPPPFTTITSSGNVICSGTSLNLSSPVSAGGQYQWFLNGTSVTALMTLNNTYLATSPGVYTVYIESTLGCNATSADFVVTTGTTPTATLNASGNIFCPGETITISSNMVSGQSIAWYYNSAIVPGQTSANYVVSQPGSYYVVITSADGCTDASTTVNIAQLPGIVANLSSAQQSFCPGISSIQLNANVVTNASYEWYNGASLISGASSNIYQALTPGSYTVVITNISGCTDTSNVVVLSNGVSPTAQISSASTVFCSGQSLNIDAIPVAGANYNWYLNGLPTGTNSPVLSASADGSYYVIVTGSDGCSATSPSIVLTMNTSPTATINAVSTVLCPGSSLVLSCNTVAGATYEWFRNGSSQGAPSTTAYTFTATQTGAYTVTIDNGCPGTSASVNVNSGTLPADITSVFGPVYACSGETVNLSCFSSSGATNYLWTISPANAATIAAGQGTTDIDVNLLSQNVNITVTPQNACGNGGSYTEPVTIDNTFCFGIQMGAYPTNVCAGSTVTVYNYTDNTQFPGGVANWNFGSGASPATGVGNGPFTLTYSSPGLKTITVDYLDSFGFPMGSQTYTDYISVSGSITTSVISGNTLLSACNGAVETYSVTNVTGSTFNWSVPANASIISGQSTNQITVNFSGPGGTISVVQTNAAGCVAPAQSVTVGCVTSVQNINLTEWSLVLFPNPSTGQVQFTIQGNQNQNFDCFVYSLSGSLCYHTNAQTSNGVALISEDFSYLPQGMYIVELRLQGFSTYQKMILKK